MILENAKQFMMSKGFCRGCEADLARAAVDEVLGSESLDQSPAGAEYYTPYVIGRATTLHYVNSTLLARIFPGWRASLYGVRHFSQPFLLLAFRQRPDLFFKQLLGGRNAFHNLPIEQTADRAHIRDLGMIFKPHRLGKSAQASASWL